MPGQPERGWIEAVRGTSVLAVAAALRLKTSPPRGTSGGSVYGCPACSAERRHAARRDRRGALGVRRDGIGFRCMDCDVSGDAIDLVALVLRGRRFSELRGDALGEVRRWFEEFAGLELSSAVATRTPVPPPPAPPVSYPPEAEVREFYDRCVECDNDAGVSAYLGGRNLRAGFVAGLQLARALPADLRELPRWASKRVGENGPRVPWTASGHRLIVPLYDERGLMRSVLARAIGHAEIKSYAPAGFTRAGLVMACSLGRWLLATGVRPEWWSLQREMRVVVAEGEADFLGWATRWSDAAEHAPATFAVISGSWTAGIASRIADESVVLIATDNDAAGDRYAAVIHESFASRAVSLERWEASA